ncbi:M13 family metallopeptidase, partial [Ferroplasma sp.]|uniref:M13 family metallopeptidase n=1 Tax=Ferroplasma sp. TaxID=2591003 RepID=UPI00307F2284
MEESENILKKDIGFSVNYMDRKRNPSTDFYGFCNGKWLEETPIPEDKSRYASFDMLYEKNMYLLKHILEQAAEKPENDNERLLGNFYKSAMDTKIIEKLRFSPIKNTMEKIDKMAGSNMPDLFAFLTMEGVQLPFAISSAEDAKNAEIYSLYINQDGLSLPDKDYYLKEEMKEILNAYKKHVKNMFVLYGYRTVEAEKSSEIVLSIETQMAKNSRSKTDLRDVEKAYNKFSAEELYEKYPDFGFDKYFKAIGVNNLKYVVIDAPEFFEQTGELIKNMEGKDLAEYLKWKVLTGSAPFLHEEVVKENFNFFRKTLLGQEKIAPRWKRAVSVIDASIGDSLGQAYVAKYFGKEAVEKITVLVNDLKDTFRERLEKNPWMSEETRKKALIKFSSFRTKIGYTEHFKDYSSIEIKPDDYIGNIDRSAKFEINRQLKRIGQNVDLTEWFMTPPTVNAYFNPTGNEIVFPAGILQPPFFNPELDDAVNYGGIGGVISHEITHGYDDQGSHFDEHGNMVNWWTEGDKKRFDIMAEKVVKLYSSMEILP